MASSTIKTKERPAPSARLPDPLSRSFSPPLDPEASWLETDGLGGYASTTVSGILHHRSHGLVVAARRPPYDRFVLINTLDIRVVTPRSREIPLSSHAFGSGIIKPNAVDAIQSFKSKPWPTWNFALDRNLNLEQELFIRRGMPVFVFSWRLSEPAPGFKLKIRPLVSARRIGQVQKKNQRFNFDVDVIQRNHLMRPYEDVPGIAMITEAEFEPDPKWHPAFGYNEDFSTTFSTATEDLASPGTFTWELGSARATFIVAPDFALSPNNISLSEPQATAKRLRNAETMRRSMFRSEVERTTDAYVVTRASDETIHIMPGYPHSTRATTDSLIAMRGICLSPGRIQLAENVLEGALADFSDGLLPTDYGEHFDRQIMEFDSPDPTLWFIVAAHEYTRACETQNRTPESDFIDRLQKTISNSVTKLLNGATQGMAVNDEGLLCSAPSLATNHSAPPAVFNVATQALWVNALAIAAHQDPEWHMPHQNALHAFSRNFWCEENGYLYDTIGAGNEIDPTLKARQILAIGGLPFPILDEARASLIVQALEDRLLTPEGLRLSEPGSPGENQISSWLMGPFIEAWYRIHQGDEDALLEIKEKYIDPWQELLLTRGLEHLGELSETPGIPSVPFSAPATAELLRILHLPDFQNTPTSFEDPEEE
ncbi:MAG: glycogen debranching enzyme N-terminal domain-containing protein [Verrucomicrobiota bacterium]